MALLGRFMGGNVKKKFGFTLIELMVVVLIIMLLAGVIIVNVDNARRKARDAKRVSDLGLIASALENYYADHHSYPAGGYWSECNAWGGLAANNVIPGLVPNYLNAFPSDPQMDKVNSVYCYIYVSNGSNYKIIDHNGPSINYLSQPTLIDPVRDGGTDCTKVDGTSPWAWSISSPGAPCW